MIAIDTRTALGLLDIDAESVPEPPKTKRRKAKPDADPTGPVFRLQGNWKRIDGVATRYELQLAIDRLLERGKVKIVGGALHLVNARGTVRARLTPEERWQRADELLRRRYETIDVHETHTRKLDDFALQPGGISFADAAATAEPSRSVSEYVLRELVPGRPAASGPRCDICPRCRATGGPADCETIITTIYECGGLRWDNEDVETVRRRARAKRGGKGR